MFFKKKDDNKPLKYSTAASFWDQAKVATIAKARVIQINLTSFRAERGFGRSASYMLVEDSQEAHGVTDRWEFPAALVMITFADQPVEEHEPPKPPTIGRWMYEVFGTEREGYVGRLLFTFFDQDGAIRTALKQAHAASLASDMPMTSLGIMKEPGVGEFSVKDRQHGWSYDSRFAFCGLQVTERYQSRHLKKWAVPYFDEDYSKDDAPF